MADFSLAVPQTLHSEWDPQLGIVLAPPGISFSHQVQEAGSCSCPRVSQQGEVLWRREQRAFLRLECGVGGSEATERPLKKQSKKLKVCKMWRGVSTQRFHNRLWFAAVGFLMKVYNEAQTDSASVSPSNWVVLKQVQAGLLPTDVAEQRTRELWDKVTFSYF